MPVLTSMVFLLMRSVEYYFALILIFAPTVSVFSQRHDNTWMFGYEGGIVSPNNDKYGITIFNFSDGSLNISDNQVINLEFYVTALAVSDLSGKLLFYTNGIDVEDITWNTMLNGGNIHPPVAGGQAITQGILGLQFPEKESQYALIHVPRGYVGPPVSTVGVLKLFYTIIDMEQNNGLGAVVEKSIPLLVDTLQLGKLKAAKHANGRDWWILVPEAYTNNIYRILLDSAGFHVIGKQTIGSKLYPGAGQADFSPDGSRYAIFDTYNSSMPDAVDVYDFDRCTGLLSNARHFELWISSYAGGVTFSPNSRYLYVHTTLVVAQYDLEAPDLAASRVELAWYDGYESPFPTHFFAGQLAPDGKIYICTSNGTDVLHVIHRPDEAGSACLVEQHGIRLPTYNATSMPNFPHYRLGPLDGSPCDTLGLDNHPKAWWRYEQDTLDALAVEFRDLSYYEPATWAWDFGDGSASSSQRHPEHQYAQPGAYPVCLTVSNQYGTDTHCKTLYLGVSAQDNPVLQAQVRVWPNPFRERFAAALSANLRSPALRLYDAAGRLMREEGLALGVSEIETGALPPGLYFWEVVAGGERVKSGKCIKLAE